MLQNKNFTYIGSAPILTAKNVKESYFGIGLEKLDRNVFDPSKTYEKLAHLGVKYVRLQSGWARTEKEKGVYDFSWLDEIVDNLLQRDLKPWMCLCYGNALYTEAAKTVFGAVGCPPIKSEEERTAWANYVTALTNHFKGRVNMYEVWNEPDGIWCWKHGKNSNTLGLYPECGTEYGEFVVRTAAAVRAGDATAKVLGGSMCGENWPWLNAMFQTGAGKAIDAFVYHGYTTNEHNQIQRMKEMKAVLHQNGLDDLPLIQGETGAQSRDDGAGALRGMAWTQQRQAKVLLRTMFQHLTFGVKFSSYFTTVDMIEALNGDVNNKASYQDYGYFGVLSADFDENGFSTGEYSPKMSYRSFQTIAAIFAERPAVVNHLPIYNVRPHNSNRAWKNTEELQNQTFVEFERPDGSCALVYWNPADPLDGDVDKLLSIKTSLTSKIRVIDLIDGSIYKVNPNLIHLDDHGMTVIDDLPLRDYPMAITFGKFF